MNKSYEISLIRLIEIAQNFCYVDWTTNEIVQLSKLSGNVTQSSYLIRKFKDGFDMFEVICNKRDDNNYICKIEYEGGIKCYQFDYFNQLYNLLKEYE